MTENQLINIKSLCDGYAEISDESYKDTFFYIEKDGKILYPFIYCPTKGEHEFIQRCIINIKKNEYIKEENGLKTTYSP